MTELSLAYTMRMEIERLTAENERLLAYTRGLETREAWQHEAFAQTVALAKERGMSGYGPLSLAHLVDMQTRLSTDMRPGKAGRWLGWAQAALEAAGAATLDEMKALNKRCSDAAQAIKDTP